MGLAFLTTFTIKSTIHVGKYYHVYMDPSWKWLEDYTCRDVKAPGLVQRKAAMKTCRKIEGQCQDKKISMVWKKSTVPVN